VVDEIEKLGYTPEIFTNPRGKCALASAKSWSPTGADDKDDRNEKKDHRHNMQNADIHPKGVDV
jgi:hypothetical protein